MALVVLLVALAVLVVKDRDFWFGNSDTTTAEDNTSEWNPNAVVQPRDPDHTRRRNRPLPPRVPPSR